MKNILLALLLLANICNGQTMNPLPYCHAPYIGNIVGGWILNVRIGSLNNISTHIIGMDEYVYYNNIPAPVLYRDSTYTLYVTFDTVCHSGTSCAGTTDNSWYRIGIPFMKSGMYNTFNTSIAFDTTNVTGTANTALTKAFSIKVPHTADTGKTRLRVVRYGFISGAGALTNRFCDSSSKNGDMGETEDYDLNIQDAPPVVSGINEIPSENMSVYPNPTTGIIHVPDDAWIAVYNTVGQLVHSASMTTTIDISHLPSGMYYLKANGSVTRIIKQ